MLEGNRNGQTGNGQKSCFQFPTVKHHSISQGLQAKVHLLHADIVCRILRVEDVNMDLWHLFADNFSFLLTYTGRASYSYFDAHKDMDYYEQ